MRAICIANTPASLEGYALQAAYSRHYHLEEIGLQVGQEYEIYGVTFKDGDGIPWFLIAEEEDDEYPNTHLSAFFRIVDYRIPIRWSYSGPNNVGDVSFLPERWATDSSFMEKMVDGELDAVSYFSELKRGQKYSMPE